MTMCEREHGYMWSFDLFQDPFAASGYHGAAIHNDGNFYADPYGHEELAGFWHSGERYPQASSFNHNPFCPPSEIYHDSQFHHDEADDMVTSVSGSSTGSKLYAGEEWSPIELSEYELGMRFHQMVPVPHIPKINGDIPSHDEATQDHQRLAERLTLYDLVEHKVQGDGNCQFRALSDQIYQTGDHHEFVRQEIVKELEAHRELYEGYVPMAYDEYLRKISRKGEWGDHVTLQAAADCYGVKIFVITSFKDTCYVEILPRDPKSKRVILLSFWAEVHYNSIYTRADLPTSQGRRKKRWWPVKSRQ